LTTTMELKNLIVGIKGAGDLATGVASRLFKSNIKKIFMMEVKAPLAVRRQVSFCEAIFEDSFVVEGIKAVKVTDEIGIQEAWKNENIPVIADPEWDTIKKVTPHVVIDAIIAKKNLGTSCSDAPLVIGLGPGFEASNDVHAVIETNRGHNLGRVIIKGIAQANTGVPGKVQGYSSERLLRAPKKGCFHSNLTIGALVKKGDVIGFVDDKKVIAQISGVLRGLIRNNTNVEKNLKIGDVDPRGKPEYCPCISEKALAIAGGVLETILGHYNK
jgi:xanthine dehydrogenase accessory factor